MTLYINGRFLTKNITGVQRFAIEVVKELDKMNIKDEIIILTPKDVNINLYLKNIKTIKIGGLKGNLWEQLSLPMFLHKKKSYALLNLCNLGPILNPGYVVLHDISFKTNPQHLNWKFSLYYKLITRININRYKHIFTVSNFSKNEIIKNYRINPDKITITYNSAEHLNEVKENSDILKKLKLEEKEFLFSLGSKSPHKNHKFIEKCAKYNPNILFVVSGDKNNNVFKEEQDEKLENIIYTGRITDAQMKALYSSCKAFIFPSTYEGFGIPPLEAIQCGCKNIMVSDIPVFREIYGNNVKYINLEEEENESKHILNKIEDEIVLNKQEFKKYTWKNTSNIIIKNIKLENNEEN